MSLVEHAKSELQRAGLLDPKSDYDGMIGTAVLELVEKFAAQGHSGTSAEITLDVFDKVAHFKPLTAISNDPSEWMEVGGGYWQSRRQPTLFSTDAGQTWYDLDEPGRPIHIPEQPKEQQREVGDQRILGDDALGIGVSRR